MPTVLRIGGYRFFFYSNENGEPAHIHFNTKRHWQNFGLNQLHM